MLANKNNQNKRKFFPEMTFILFNVIIIKEKYDLLSKCEMAGALSSPWQVIFINPLVKCVFANAEFAVIEFCVPRVN